MPRFDSQQGSGFDSFVNSGFDSLGGVNISQVTFGLIMDEASPYSFINSRGDLIDRIETWNEDLSLVRVAIADAQGSVSPNGNILMPNGENDLSMVILHASSAFESGWGPIKPSTTQFPLFVKTRAFVGREELLGLPGMSNPDLLYSRFFSILLDDEPEFFTVLLDNSGSFSGHFDARTLLAWLENNVRIPFPKIRDSWYDGRDEGWVYTSERWLQSLARELNGVTQKWKEGIR